jgi:hypothetical protein
MLLKRKSFAGNASGLVAVAGYKLQWVTLWRQRNGVGKFSQTRSALVNGAACC